MPRMPPPPLPVSGTVFQLTSLWFSVAVAPNPLAIPPPASDAKLPVTAALFRVSVPERFKMPPPAPPAIIPVTCPPVTVTRLRVSAPPELPSIAMIRKLLLFPAIVAPFPLIVSGETSTGKPLPPMTALSRAVSEYVQPAARLIDPPPDALIAFTAATSPVTSPQDTFTDDDAPAEVEATNDSSAVEITNAPRRRAPPGT